MQWILKLHAKTHRLIDHVWRYFSGTPTQKRSRILPHLYLGGQLYKQGMRKLNEWGVTAVVSMRMSVPKKFFTNTKIKVLHLPVLEHTAPSIEQLHEGVHFIKEEIANGGTVYIHCLHGEGRGPTMAVAYLISIGYSFDDALKDILTIRPFVNPSQTQLHQLAAFAAILEAIE